MTRLIIIGVSIVGLTLAGCGSDDDGSSLSGPQAAAAQSAIDSAAEEGVELDESCVDDVAAQLSDDDVELAAGSDDAELSPAGEELTLELLNCADEEALIDLFVSGFADEGIDSDCARDTLSDFGVGELIAAVQSGGQPPAELVQAIVPCVDGVG